MSRLAYPNSPLLPSEPLKPLELLKLFPLKICTSANFVVPLQSQTKSLWTYYKKRLLALVLAYRNPENFTNPRQDDSKRPLGYVYPAAERPLWTALFGGISYSAWALLACSC